MTKKIDDICPAAEKMPPQSTEPHSPPIMPASVYRCNDPSETRQILSGEQPGYVYQRDRHPNADMLAEKCCQLHGAEAVTITSSGMSALSSALLSQLSQGDHLVASNLLYGRTLDLLDGEASRLGITSSIVDTNDLTATEAAFTESTRLLVVETITNPLLRVSDISRLASLAHRHHAKLLVDNTFASPFVCRPLDLGADFVMESISKIINGHSDVMMGMLCGRLSDWERVPAVSSIWGLASSPFDCWLALRGLATLHLRAERAGDNALAAARMLANHKKIERVHYPGLTNHIDHELAAEQFGDRFGSIVTFDLSGGYTSAETFISAVENIPFCPSLGEVSTTLSHPASTSHRGLRESQQQEIGITGATIRLSLGTESAEYIIKLLQEALSTMPD